jgi:L-lactate dehydrogenase complex protein LldG
VATSDILLDRDDVVGSFVRNAETLRATVHRVGAPDVPEDLLRSIVERYGVRRAVISREPEAQAVGAQLRALGVHTDDISVATSAAADIGVTSAIAAIALTGTVVQDSSTAGGRTGSLLPPVHLCVFPASRIVPMSDEVLRPLGRRAAREGLPANLVLVTGPSRSGDIEQIIALGVHGPVSVEFIVLEHGSVLTTVDAPNSIHEP